MFKSMIRTTGLFVVLTVLLAACQPIQRLPESTSTSLTRYTPMNAAVLSLRQLFETPEEIGLIEACRKYQFAVNTCDWGDKNDKSWCRTGLRTYGSLFCIGDRLFQGDSCWPHWENGYVQGYQCTNKHTCNSVAQYLWYVQEKNFDINGDNKPLVKVRRDCSDTNKFYYWK